MDVFVGVDVSKDSLEVAAVSAADGEQLETKRFANRPAGIQAFLAWTERYEEPHVVMEATGNYHLLFSRLLAEAGLRQSIVNPLQVRRFAQMRLRRVKTDRSDALQIARYGQSEKPEESEPPRAAQAKLKQLATLIDALTRQRTALKNQQHASEWLPEPSSVCDEVLRRQLEAIEEHLEELKAEQERLAADEFREVAELIGSVKGVGPRTTCALLAYAGDLSGFETPKQLAAFMGLNPVSWQSGTLSRPSHISKKGHKRLRTLFYMAAQSARKYNRSCRLLYDRLRAKGKKRKVALIAVANKLVRQVFAVVKSRTPYDNDYEIAGTI